MLHASIESIESIADKRIGTTSLLQILASRRGHLILICQKSEEAYFAGILSVHFPAPDKVINQELPRWDNRSPLYIHKVTIY